MLHGVRALAVAALASTGLLSCRKAPAPDEVSTKAPPAAASASVAPVASAPAPVMSSLEPRALVASPCRVLRVKGSARAVGGAPLAALSPLDGKAWVELEAGAEVSVRHGATSREFSLQGPGLFLPCRLGLEQILISEGEFVSSRGSGVRPGAEMWVSTPAAALHYGDADAHVRVEHGSLRVRVTSGSLVAESSVGGASQSLTLAGPNAEKRWAFSAASGDRAKRCEVSARKAKEGADQVLAATGSELGPLAAAQLESRRRARADCLIAETSIEGTKDPGEKARLSDQVAQANQLWQGIPAMVR
jgi:hypothetical protein